MTSLARLTFKSFHICCRRSNKRPILDQIQSLGVDLAHRANVVTGYNEIEHIKRNISNSESSIEALKLALETSRKDYSIALKNHSSVQRSINDLLHRKHEWNSQDVEKLSQLYRQDHEAEKLVETQRSKTELSETELEKERTNLGKLMMDRYREEQIWSDKIRQFSTWGTMILMAVNVCLFIVVQLVLEPWKRRRLVAQFEEKVKSQAHLASSPQLPPAPVKSEQSPSETSLDPAKTLGWKDWALNCVDSINTPHKAKSKAQELWASFKTVCHYLKTEQLSVRPVELICFVSVSTIAGYIVGQI